VSWGEVPACSSVHRPHGKANAAHPGWQLGEGCAMIDYNGAPRYRIIIIRGNWGQLLVSLVDRVQVEPSEGGDTCVVALLRDDPE
jgi:hypothetical protein